MEWHAGRRAMRLAPSVLLPFSLAFAALPASTTPRLVFSTYLGGDLYDFARGVATDGEGCIYVAGTTNSTTLPVTAGAVQERPSRLGDAFVAKLDPCGERLIYCTYLGGSGIDEAEGIAVDDDGNAYVVGMTKSADFPVTSGAFQPRYGGAGATDGDIFIAKLDAGGSLAFATFLGGGDTERAFAIRVDAERRVHVAGLTQSLDFPTTTNAYRSSVTSLAVRPVYTVLGADGRTCAYSTYLGGDASARSRASALALDSEGRAIIVGANYDSVYPTTPGVVQPLPVGLTDGFVTKIDSTRAGTASIVWSTMLGGTAYDEPWDVTVTAAGDVVVVGATESRDFPVTAGAFQASGPASFSHAGFVAKLDSTASRLVFSTFLHGAGADAVYAVALDESANVWVTGGTTSADFPVTPDAVMSSRPASAGSTAFILELDEGGSRLLWSSFLGGDLNDPGQGVAWDRARQSVVACGFTQSSDFPTTPGALREVDEDGAYPDAFIARLGPSIVIADAAANPAVLWPPNHRLVEVRIDYTTLDGCGRPTAATCRLDVASDEREDAAGDGHAAPDHVPLDAHRVLLRSERAGGGAGRTYSVTIECESAGYRATETLQVVVPHDAPR